ncbi:MAG: Wzz/FepE/Etk N-terminal domain-containing protein [Marinifilaceae bacterium]|jgi:LPS O-antigen subunit length determinant protein (WzzB/FepE family)|nr:Wzz/FepE/Etk N-terminal domain-containing protein [Marinifilaceae bacterium]
MQENLNENTKENTADEIDLIDLAKSIWAGRKTILKITAVFFAIGLFVAIFSEKEYTAKTIMIPRTNKASGGLGNLGGLAAMAGINIGDITASESLPPAMYPKIVESLPFRLELIKTKLKIDGLDREVSFEEYYRDIYKPSVLSLLKSYTIGLPGKIISLIKGKDESADSRETNRTQVQNEIVSLSSERLGLVGLLKEKINLEIDKADGYINLEAKMPEALAAAQLAKRTQELLQSAITDFKNQKAKDKLKFIEGRFEEKKIEFEKIQEELKEFEDKNKFTSKAVAKIEGDRLRADYNLVYGVYSELAKQLETQKIQVKEDTPVFSILEPVSVPVSKSAPKSMLILVVFSFIGIIIGGVTFLVKGIRVFI